MRDEPDYLQLTREILDDWEVKAARSQADVLSRGRSQADYPVLHALASHTHNQAKAILILAEADLFMEAMPMLRSAYECAITASWIAALDDSLAAFGQESVRTRHITMALIRRISPGSSDTPSNAASSEAITAMETSARGRARQFAQVCDDLRQVGKVGYLCYRLMSSYSHPSVDLADLYVETPVAVDGIPDLLYRARTQQMDVWMSLLFGSLIWAGQAVEAREKGHGRKKYLRSMAKRGQVAPALEMSETAWLRETNARRERQRDRRAAWQRTTNGGRAAASSRSGS